MSNRFEDHEQSEIIKLSSESLINYKMAPQMIYFYDQETEQNFNTPFPEENYHGRFGYNQDARRGNYGDYDDDNGEYYEEWDYSAYNGGAEYMPGNVAHIIVADSSGNTHHKVT